jgi:type I restriction enzyme S subunit
MTLKRYERYKDSGVECLGPVPAHWQVTRLKFIAHVQTGVAKGKDNTGQETISVPYLRVANVQDGYLDLDEVATIEIPAADLQRYRLRAGDVLMNEGGDFDKLGRGHVWDGSIDPCIHQNHVFAVRPFGVSPQWLNLVTGSAYAQFYFMSRSKQSTNLASISSTNVMELPIVLPPREEQVTIANYLSNETTKIDTLIAAQQRLIESLTEKRQAVMALAVTKGLNPAAPMRDSGVEWLGDVPAHWTVVRLKFVAHVQTGIAKGKDNTGKELIDVAYLRVANVQDGFIDLDDVSTLEVPVDDLDRYRLRAGDVLMNEGGDFDKLGRGHVWDGSIDPCIHQNHVFAVRPFGVSPDWLNAITGSAYAQFYFMSRSKQSTNLASISSTNLMELPVVVPPATEQATLLYWIDAQSAAFDDLIDNAKSAVSLLHERRAALIAAAVTGQIDVRGHPSLGTDSEEAPANIAATRHGARSASTHLAGLQAMASADEQPALPPTSC